MENLKVFTTKLGWDENYPSAYLAGDYVVVCSEGKVQSEFRIFIEKDIVDLHPQSLDFECVLTWGLTRGSNPFGDMEQLLNRLEGKRRTFKHNGVTYRPVNEKIYKKTLSNWAGWLYRENGGCIRYKNNHWLVEGEADRTGWEEDDKMMTMLDTRHSCQALLL